MDIKRMIAVCLLVIVMVVLAASAAMADPCVCGSQGAGQSPNHVPASAPGNS